MHKPVTISIEISPGHLAGYSNEQLVVAWHLTQANPAPHGDKEAGEITELVAREIIKRWIGGVEPQLWQHQGRDHFWSELRKHGKWVDGTYTPNAPASVEA